MALSALARRLRALLKASGVAVVVVALAVCAFVVWPLDEDALLEHDSSVQVLARDGTVLATGLNAEGARSIPLAQGVVPPLVGAAFVAVEDRRFADHPGVDVKGVLRAVRDSIVAGRVVSGASTITQQLARRLGKRGPGLRGKIEEALWALRIDAHVEKAHILAAYLDRVPLGRNTVGVEAASRLYFGTRAGLLSTSQAAQLAGMAHAPQREDPVRSPASAHARRDEVLERMHASAFIDAADLARALAEPFDAAIHGDDDVTAPHLATRLRNEFSGSSAVGVQTTIDVGLQRKLEAIVAEEVLRGPHREDGLAHAAVVVVDNASGEVLAWVGSANYFDDLSLGKNDGVTAQRQPGSALKPFVYGLGLARGLTPATILDDVDTALAVDDGGTYAPQNYDRRMHGPVPLRAALQNSYNVPAIQVARRLGPEAVLQVLRNAGFSSLNRDPGHYGVGLVLGNGEVTLLEMATAYRGLAAGGVYRPLVVVREAWDEKRNSVPVAVAPGPSVMRFLPEDAVALLTHILSDDAARAPAFGLDNALDLEFQVAAKTGTSRSYVDNWTAGFTAERTVAVWAGSFDGTAMRGVSGISGAGVVFRRAMQAAMAGIEPAPLLDDVTLAAKGFERARICPLSGSLAGSSCPAVDEVFLPGSAPTVSCSVHDHGSDDVVDGCAFGERALSLPGSLGAWATREGRCQRAPALVRAGLLSPKDGDVFALDPGIPAGQEIPLRSAGVARVVVDGADAGVTGWLSLRPGAHHAIAYDDNGAVVDEARFSVR
ncbi:MAG: penicillin-binding protein 1C [Deltaproteobacteria bacterium]|nr:penicillin-binding protein 1C [Deltaproteobacteria bacterium]